MSDPVLNLTILQPVSGQTNKYQYQNVIFDISNVSDVNHRARILQSIETGLISGNNSSNPSGVRAVIDGLRGNGEQRVITIYQNGTAMREGTPVPPPSDPISTAGEALWFEPGTQSWTTAQGPAGARTDLRIMIDLEGGAFGQLQPDGSYRAPYWVVMNVVWHELDHIAQPFSHGSSESPPYSGAWRDSIRELRGDFPDRAVDPASGRSEPLNREGWTLRDTGGAGGINDAFSNEPSVDFADQTHQNITSATAVESGSATNGLLDVTVIIPDTAGESPATDFAQSGSEISQGYIYSGNNHTVLMPVEFIDQSSTGDQGELASSQIVSDQIRPGDLNLADDWAAGWPALPISYDGGFDVITSGSLFNSSIGYTGTVAFTDPLVLDLNGNGVELTDWHSWPVLFDIDDDGSKELTGWAVADDGSSLLILIPTG